MKRNLHLTILLTLCSAIMLHTSCKNNIKKEENTLEKAFAISQKANDYSTSTVLLTQMFALDSIKYAWAADTLAYYHYVNAIAGNDIAELNSANYFIEAGLEMDSDNGLLNTLKAQASMLEKKDTIAVDILKEMYSKSKDAKYLFYLSSVYIASGQPLMADSIVMEQLNSSDSLSSSVSVQDMINRSWQQVPKKAAFQFLKANVVMSTTKDQLKGVREGMKILNDCLRIAPDFGMAQTSMMQIQQSLMQAGYR